MTADHDALRELLARLAHEQWSGWMHHLFAQSTRNPDGTVTIPAWAVERWSRQMQTPYDELAGPEKDSDRTEADKFLAVIRRPAIAPPDNRDVRQVLSDAAIAGLE
jgi:hypothetical protein